MSVVPGLTGIDAWNQLRTGNASATDEASFLPLCWRAISAAPRDVTLPKPLRQFMTLVGKLDDESFCREIIESFEFSMRNPAAEELEPQIMRLLPECGHAWCDGEARELFRNLFLRVTRTISQAGVKVLTKLEGVRC